MLGIIHFERGERVIAKVAHARIERTKQKLAHPQVVDQFAAFINDVDDIESFAVVSELADVVEHVLHRPIFVNGDEVRRHQAADAAFGITEQRLRNLALLGCEQLDQLPRGRARQFFEQRSAIVRRHFVQNSDDLLVGHSAQQFLLRFNIEIFKNIRRECRRQDAENDDLVVFVHVEDHFRDIGRRPFAKHLAQRGEIPRVDQAFDFGYENFADHENLRSRRRPSFNIATGQEQSFRAWNLTETITNWW